MPTLSRIVRCGAFLALGVSAAYVLAQIAHYDLGLSRTEIREPATFVAGVIAMLLVFDFVGSKFDK